MPLPHFTQLLMTGSPGGPGTKPHEPVYKNLFEMTFILPTILQAQGRDPLLMLQQAMSITLDFTKDIGTKEQRFKYSTRKFVTVPESTSIDFNVKFEVNVNLKGSMETWAALKAWYDLVWNSQNGVLHYKADIIGTLVVNQHDRKGLVIRRGTFQNVQIIGINAMDLDWGSTAEIWQLDAKFCADYWIDEYIDGNFVIAPPRIAGYP